MSPRLSANAIGWICLLGYAGLCGLMLWMK